MIERKLPFEGAKEDLIVKAGERMSKAFRKVLLDFKPDGKNDNLDNLSKEEKGLQESKV